MQWMQCIMGIDECYERIRDGVDLLTLRAGDAGDVALLSRTTADRRHRVLLLSPLAAELAGPDLSSRWTPCDGPELFEWDLVVGPPDARERFGLRRPRFGGPPEPTPVAMIGRDPMAESRRTSAR
jgi:hypothetical protein